MNDQQKKKLAHKAEPKAEIKNTKSSKPKTAQSQVQTQVKTKKADKTEQTEPGQVSVDIDHDVDQTTVTEEGGLVINEDLVDMLGGMADRLEETTDMAEKVKLHSELSNLTNSIKTLIGQLIEDVDASKIMTDPATIFAEDFDKDAGFDMMDEIQKLKKETDEMDETDDLRKQVAIYKKLNRKCQVLKIASDEGDLVIRKVN